MGNFTIALNTWLKDGRIGSQQWSPWCRLGCRQGSITRQVKWMWSEVLCHSCWKTPLRTKKHGSSAGVHPSDTKTRSKPSATPEVERFFFFFFFYPKFLKSLLFEDCLEFVLDYGQHLQLPRGRNVPISGRNTLVVSKERECLAMNNLIGAICIGGHWKHSYHLNSSS